MNALLKEAVDLLRFLEWRGDVQVKTCPCCRRPQFKGEPEQHNSNCKLGDFLRKMDEGAGTWRKGVPPDGINEVLVGDAKRFMGRGERQIYKVADKDGRLVPGWTTWQVDGRSHSVWQEEWFWTEAPPR